MSNNLIVEAIKERGYLADDPAHELARQLLKLTEELAEAADHVYIDTVDAASRHRGAFYRWESEVAAACDDARVLIASGAPVAVYPHNVAALRGELVDIYVALIGAWEMCRLIDGDETLLEVAALRKATADVERGTR